MLCRSLIHLSRVSYVSTRTSVQIIPRLYRSTESYESNVAKNTHTGDQTNDLTNHPAASTISGINEGANLADFLYPPTFNTREKRMAATLEKLDFSQEQTRRIIAYYRDRNSIYSVDPSVIQPAFEFWITAVKPPKSRKDAAEEVLDFPAHERMKEKPFYQIKSASKNKKLRSGEEVDAEDGGSFEFDYRKTEVRAILSKNPLLLLVCPKSMNQRLKLLYELGIFSGRNDIWRVFHHAPIAFFLQDWAEFLRKFYFIQHRVLEWYLDKSNPYPTPHPVVKDAKVFDLPYHVIKARFEFAIKSGLKSPTLISKFSSDPITLSLRDILASPIDEYLRRVTPGLTEEEYHVYEKYTEDKDDPEDRMISEMASLQANANYDTANMQRELAKRIAGAVLEETLTGYKEPLENVIGTKNSQHNEDRDGDYDPLEALKDELALKRQMYGKKKAKLMKQRDEARLRLIFPGSKPYPDASDQSAASQVDRAPFIELRKRSD